MTALIQEREGPLVILTMNQPERRNALSHQMREDLHAAFEAIEADKAVRAVVITGAQGHFSAGGDISGMNTRDALSGRERFRRIHRLIRLMVGGSKPVVAAVEGYAVGAGLSIATASDHVVASETAKFSAPFAKVGLMGDLGLLWTLPQRIGAGKARQMLLFGEMIGAAEALAIRLVDRMVKPGEALAVAKERALLLAELPPASHAMTKAVLAHGLDEFLERERQGQALLLLTEDHEEGKRAFLEKRKPVFKGV
ncbi:MAG: enoyl-CoA hydratase/isomerase family protein [Alphaproteobacteria bacterium]|nr:enoyl-CoA hydratase/isomerase family protein [Alphaproteobacteria bacterium]